jgi:FAD/FMN-containing dehydrogenase
MRHDFTDETKRTLANRVANRCSRPQCRAQTSGPQIDGSRALNVGVAAHITAAAPGGPRYDSALSSEARSGPDNGIWLCQVCGKLVDNDPLRFTEDELRRWKLVAEWEALERIGRATGTVPRSDAATDITELLRRVTSRSERLSLYLAETLALARRAGLAALEQFAARELVGWYEVPADSRPRYRIVPVFISLTHQVNIDYVGWGGEPDRMLRDMANSPEEFIPSKLFFPNPVSFFEQERPQDPFKSLLSLTLKVRDFMPSSENPDMPVFVYGAGTTPRDTLDHIHRELTERLVEAITSSCASPPRSRPALPTSPVSP